jgi:hypothetical protein
MAGPLVQLLVVQQPLPVVAVLVEKVETVQLEETLQAVADLLGQ